MPTTSTSGNRVLIVDNSPDNANSIVMDVAALDHGTVLFVQSNVISICGTGRTGVNGEGALYGVLGSATTGLGLPPPVDQEPAGVFGMAHDLGSTAIGARAENGALAGHFKGGDVVIEQSLIVRGGLVIEVHPSLALPPRSFQALASPESWFEDFGEGKLKNGEATLNLHMDFAAAVDTQNYHVFLTPTGDSQGLYVASRSPAGFKVVEQHGGKSSVAFSYRVVAKRKDVTAARFAKFDGK